MVFLSAPDPWRQLVVAYRDRLAVEAATALPQLADMGVAVDRSTVVVSLDVEVPDRRRAVWLMAATVAQCWPGWLDDIGVGARFTVPGLTVAATCGAMTGLGAGTLHRPQWWVSVDVTIGDLPGG